MIYYLPYLKQNPLQATVALESEHLHPIVQRALAFTATLKWENPSVLDAKPADDEIVATYGTPGHTDYMAVSIEMRWSTSAREHILVTSNAGDRGEVSGLLDSPIMVVVTCSQTDVIHHHFPGIDLD